MPPKKIRSTRSGQADNSTGKLVAVILVLIIAIVALEQLTSPVIDTSDLPKDGSSCEGEPLYVDYPYERKMVQPHACQIQCDDEIWRHIVYTNEMATQCQRPPGC